MFIFGIYILFVTCQTGLKRHACWLVESGHICQILVVIPVNMLEIPIRLFVYRLLIGVVIAGMINVGRVSNA
jgi:hypothetical protein